jgi:prepilin-type processing-associated H-X9-DG protein
MSTDLLHSLSSAPHRTDRSPGLNALFADGHVIFQSARRHPSAFDAALWNNIGSDALNFRRAMAMWEP